MIVYTIAAEKVVELKGRANFASFGAGIKD
jgi:hypothetical protein